MSGTAKVLGARGEGRRAMLAMASRETADASGRMSSLWVLYGVAIHSAPVIVANLIVGIAAIYTSLRLILNRRVGTNP
jgi:hypothetical protein